MKQTIGFKSVENGAAKLPVPYAAQDTSRSAHRNRRRSGRAAGKSGARQSGVPFALMLIAVLAFSTLFSFKAAAGMAGGAAELMQSVSGAGQNGESGGSGSDGRNSGGLGRLRLIELPGLISVFAPSGVPVMPFAPEAWQTGDDLTAKLYAAAGTQVYSVLAGSVRSVAPGVVIVACADEIEVTYMGLADIAVERGQPVMQRTVLGVLERDVLYIKVSQNGRPLAPLDFLGAGARIG